jgi:hypothetical protein
MRNNTKVLPKRMERKSVLLDGKQVGTESSLSKATSGRSTEARTLAFTMWPLKK